jgi:hypothetical protein
MASAGPETTQDEGALIAAMESASPNKGFTSCSDIGRASIAPGGMLCMSRPLAATSSRASSSEKTPARQAATYSPMLWPIIARGRKPHLIQSRARAYSVTKSEG